MQSYSKRVANAKSDKYHQNIHKRGKVFEGKEVDVCPTYAMTHQGAHA